MNPNKIQDALALYKERFELCNIPERRFPLDKLLDFPENGLAHAHTMTRELNKLFSGDAPVSIEKLNRWLGFIQGCLWMARRFTINDLRSHNRP